MSSYSPLPASQADASWVGRAAYTPLSAGAADASWYESGSGGSDLVAVGFSSSAFGTPTSRENLAVEATSLVSGGIGEPATDVSPVTESVLFSITSSRFGVPIYHPAHAVSINHVGIALGIDSSSFGVPMLGIDLEVQASGSATGVFGTPGFYQTVGADSLNPTTEIGEPGLDLSVHPRGFQFSMFGTTVADRGCLVVSGGQLTSWGGAEAVVHFEHVVDSISPSLQFGSPVVGAVRRTLHLPPTSRFGKPLVRREAVC